MGELIPVQKLETFEKLSANHFGILLGQTRNNIFLQSTKLEIRHLQGRPVYHFQPNHKNVQKDPCAMD